MKPSLVLLHGWGLGPRAWGPALPWLMADFEVGVAALPGYDGEPAADYDLDALADALADALPGDAVLCGWSLGALVALVCAVRHPAKVAKLVLVGGTASFVARPHWPEALPQAQLDAFVTELERDAAALLKRFALLIHRGDAKGREAARALAPCLADGPPADAASLRAGLDLLGSADLARLLAVVNRPTLLIHGAADPLMPVAAAHRLASHIPGAELAVFEGSGHAPFAGEPRRFAERLAAFAGAAA